MVTLPSLYPHQETMRDDIRNALATHRRAILQAPPGTGKTRLAKWIMGAYQAREKRPDESGNAMFAVHRRGLVDNASDSFGEHPALRHGLIMAGCDTSPGCRIQVASIDTKNSWYCEGGTYTTDYTYDLIVFDETHSHLSKLRTFLEPHDARRAELGLAPAFVLGLSATPQNRELHHVYKTIVNGPSPQWLIDNNYLSAFKYFQCTQGDLKKLVKRGDDYTQDSQASCMAGMAGDLVKDWKRLAQGRSTVGFFPRLSQAREAMELLRAEGVDAEYVDGNTPDDQRKLLFSRLNEGRFEYLCNVGVIERGTDIPRVGCVQMCTAVGNVVRWRQMIGRGSRVHPEVDDCCLARGTMILTDRGEVPIESVRLSDKLWDGIEFVCHDGPCCMGARETIAWEGVTLTPDHEVLTDDGWKEAEEAKAGGWRPVVGGIGGQTVRTPDDSNPHHTEDWRTEAIACGGGLLGVRAEKLDRLPQSHQAPTPARLYSLPSQVRSSLPGVALAASTAPAAAVPVPTERILPSLRRAWHRISILLDIRGCLLDCFQSWLSTEQVMDPRPDRQQRALRARQLAVGDSADAITQPRISVEGQAAAGLPICDVLRHPSQQSQEGRPELQTDRGPMAVEVWDIRNAGPRNRFVANGVVVANCVLDHADNIRRLGFFEDEIDWTLEWGERPSKEHEARATVECPKCGAVYRGGKCKECDYEPTVRERKSQGLEFSGGKLVEVKSRETKPAKKKTCAEMMTSALFAAGKRGMTFGQAWGIAKRQADKQGTKLRVPATIEVAGKTYRTIPYGDPDGKRRVSDTYGFTVGDYSAAANPYRVNQ